MSTQSLHRDDIAGCREIRFIDRQETNYPTLMRLCMDFDLCVLQIMYKDTTSESGADFALANNDYSADVIALRAPPLASLKLLEEHVQQHLVDILHEYLFGETEEHCLSG